MIFIILMTSLLSIGCSKKCDTDNGEVKVGDYPNESCEAPTTPSTSQRIVSSFFSGINVAGQTGNMAIDSNNNIYYPDPNGYEIQKITPSGVQSVFAGNGTNAYTDGTGVGASFYAPRLIAIDSNDNLYLADGFKVRKITSSGVTTTLASMSNSGDFRGIAADKNGNVFVVWDDGSPSTHQIQKISSAGVVSVFAGSSSSGDSDGTGVAASFNYPISLAVDSSNNLFVADTGNYLIRKISPTGEVTKFAGSGFSGYEDGIGQSASFHFYNSYSHMAIDSLDNIFVGDLQGVGSTDYRVIRKITSLGSVTTYCGTNSNSFTPTGSCDSVAVISRFGIGVDSDGYVYFADTSGISRVSP